MHFVSVVQVVSVNSALLSATGREDKSPQMLLDLGRLCIVLRETSFYYKAF